MLEFYNDWTKSSFKLLQFAYCYKQSQETYNLMNNL